MCNVIKIGNVREVSGAGKLKSLLVKHNTHASHYILQYKMASSARCKGDRYHALIFMPM